MTDPDLDQKLPNMTIREIAVVIEKDWHAVHASPARPYLMAFYCMDNLKDKYRLEDGTDIALRFLVNARSWTGAVARLVKADLNLRVREAV